MEANYFTIFWWFSSYIDMNQTQVYMCPLSQTPSHAPHHPIPLSYPSALALSATSHIELGLVIYFTYGNIHTRFDAILSYCPTLAFYHIVQ